jgi:hypothetical protein
VLGAFSPLAFFVVWNTPPLTEATPPSSPEYALLQLMLVTLTTVAGVIGNVRLHPLLKELSGRRDVARNVLGAWLAGNLFLGSQICWVLRPFIWDPNHSVIFFSPDSLNGNFYETVFEALKRLIS